MSFLIKICGITTPDAIEACAQASGDLVGFVFAPNSPRLVDVGQYGHLAAQARGLGLGVVALFSNTEEAVQRDVFEVFLPDYVQLHGGESPQAVADFRQRFPSVKIIAAVGVSKAQDVARIADYGAASDLVLLDAQPPLAAAYQGGHGQVFDWDLLGGLNHEQAFLLSGGLKVENVGQAIRAMKDMGVRCLGVDVSSGVESKRGVKSVDMIRNFVAAARIAGS